MAYTLEQALSLIGTEGYTGVEKPRWAMDGPPGRACAATPERGNPELSAGPDDGASVFAYFCRDWQK